MKQAQQMQANMQEMQQNLGNLRFEQQAAGGKLSVQVDGHGVMVALNIDPSIVDPSDSEFLSNLILQTYQSAFKQAEQAKEAEMKKATGGLSLPGGLGF